MNLHFNHPDELTPAVKRACGMLDAGFYNGFQSQALRVVRELLAFLVRSADQGARVAAYGAAAKGNTLLNYCRIGPGLVEYCVDRNPAKQNTLLPGSRIPVFDVEELRRRRPDFVLILPWNLKAEVIRQLSDLRAGGTRFVTAVPSISVTA